ncbi:CFA_G0011070.mRNA.1.CDS.1 [Saccharomyces cerevisiae]|nr:CFA_G0011070.mRNA.1.CDS.1 [Saccharomyces cerevisiae]CAI7211381.1 CFA_G0011070.mRNA.1.CDS.1 [Saccharomyces cerevisiae]
MIFNLPVSVLLYFSLIWAMEPSFVRGKNVVNLITFKDSNGKLHKRLAPEEIPPRLHSSQVNSYPLGYMGMRDFSRPAVNLDDILGTQQRKQQEFMAELSPLSLESKLSLVNEVQIFASYVRNDVETYNKVSDPNEDLVIIAPTNRAVSQLTLKPWQFPNNIDKLESDGATEKELDTAIQENISKFVRSHIVVYNDDKNSYKKVSPGCTLLQSIDFTESKKSDSETGGDILLKKKGEVYYVASSRDEKFHAVESIENGSNGVILMVDFTLVGP